MHKFWDKRREILKQILTDLRNGIFASEELWTSCSLVPRNPITGTKYKGANRLVLALNQAKCGYEYNCWVTFKQLQSKGLKLKDAKGKGVTVGKYKIAEKRDKDTKEVIGSYPMYQSFTLFNLDLVESSPDEKAAIAGAKFVLEDNQYLPLADSFIEASPFSIVESNIKEPEIDFDNRTITIPDRRRFRTSESFLSVVLHELIKVNLSLAKETKEFPESYKNLSAQVGVLIAFAELGLRMSQEVREDCNSYIQFQLDEIAFNENSGVSLNLEEILSDEWRCKMLWSAIANADKAYFSLFEKQSTNTSVECQGTENVANTNSNQNATGLEFELEEGDVSF